MSNYTNKTASLRDYYEAGRDTGLNWMHNWRPGGPWCTRDIFRYPDSTRRDAEKLKIWFMGFDKGVAKSAKKMACYRRLRSK